MAKPLKIVLVVLGVIVGLVVTLAIALPLLFDPNDYRDEIAAAVKKETGREFAVGNIELKVFPWLRVALAEATLGNAAGFGPEPFAKVGEVGVGMRLWPLLVDRKVIVSTVSLKGLALNLAKNEKGESNWQDLLDRPEQDSKAEIEAQGEFEVASVDVAGLEIRESSLSYADAQARTSYRLDDLELTTGALQPGAPFDFDAGAKIVSTAPAADLVVAIEAHVVPGERHERLDVEDLKVSVKGRALELDTDATLAATIRADLQGQVYELAGLSLDATLKGERLPGGEQKLRATSELRFDQGAGTLALTNTRLTGLGLDASAEIRGSGLNGDAAKLEGPVRIAPFSPRALLDALGEAPQTRDPKALSSASLTAEVRGDARSARLTALKATLDDSTITGELALADFRSQAIRFALRIDAIDADRYLAPEPEGAAGGEGGGDEGSVDEIPIPSEMLEKLNASGTVEIGSLKLNGLKMTDVSLKLSGAAGEAKQQDLRAQLYGGTIAATNRIAPGERSTIAIKTRLDALRAQPFLQDLLGRDLLSGIGDLTLDVQGSGATVGEVRRSLDGEIAFRLNDAVVKGFNLAAMLRKAQATLAGDLNYTEKATPQTDFATIAFAGRITNGVLHSEQLEGASPLFRLAGSGDINLVDMTIDYLARPTIVETSKGQGGKGLEELKGLTIPIKLTGSLLSPKYKIELDDVLRDKAKQQLKKEYEKHEDEVKDQLKEKLGDFLFGKPKAPAPAPSDPAPAPSTPPPS